MLRVNDMVGPEVTLAAVRAGLAARGIAEADRDERVGAAVRAVVAPTAAGTVITLERRGNIRRPRFVVLRRLAAVLESLVDELESGARGPRKSGGNRTEPPVPRS